MADVLSVAELLTRGLAGAVAMEFEDDRGNKPTVMLERVIGDRQTPYFFVQALEVETKRHFSGTMVTYELELHYCVPRPAEASDYRTMMDLSERMCGLLQVVELLPDRLFCRGEKITCSASSKGIVAKGHFTLRREVVWGLV